MNIRTFREEYVNEGDRRGKGGVMGVKGSGLDKKYYKKPSSLGYRSE
jgi:hypothetical protein